MARHFIPLVLTVAVAALAGLTAAVPRGQAVPPADGWAFHTNQRMNRLEALKSCRKTS